MSVTDEQLDVLRRAPLCLHSLNNVATGTGYHIWTLYRAGYLKETAREPSGVTYWITTYDLTDLGRWTVEANRDRPAYVEPVQTAIKLGDTITMSGRPRMSWWKRAMVRLGLMREPESVLKKFVVTAVAGGEG